MPNIQPLNRPWQSHSSHTNCNPFRYYNRI